MLETDRRYLLRLEKGEEIVETLRRFARKVNLKAASLTGIGAVDRMTLGFFDPAAKEYRRYEHRGIIEILSLTGNVAWKDGECVVHAHVSAAEEKAGAMGGHLFSGTVSATVEIVVEPFATRIERALDEEVGLPLLDLPKVDLS